MAESPLGEVCFGAVAAEIGQRHSRRVQSAAVGQEPTFMEGWGLAKACEARTAVRCERTRLAGIAPAGTSFRFSFK